MKRRLEPMKTVLRIILGRALVALPASSLLALASSVWMGSPVVAQSAISASGVGGRPAAVSPGEERGISAVEGRCPTFSWGFQPGASSSELVVFEVDPDSSQDEAAPPALRQIVAGSASTWTPPLERCLERGRVYAWSVRALTKESSSPWAAHRFFEVAAGPTREDFEAALGVVREYLASSTDSEAKRSSSMAADGTHRPKNAEPTGKPSASRAGPRRVGASTVVESYAFATDGAVRMGGLLDIANGLDFTGRVITTGDTMTGLEFSLSLQPEVGPIVNVCTSGYRPCTAWEAMVLDVLSTEPLFLTQGWVVGSFPNQDDHMRSLVNGQHSLVCPFGYLLTKFPSDFVHGPITTPGGIHCRDWDLAFPVHCCRNDG